MILKIFKSNDGHDKWTWYDNIEQATTYYNEETKCVCIDLKIKDREGIITQAIEEPSYLCNDLGQTIEKLYAAPRRSRRELSPVPSTD